MTTVLVLLASIWVAASDIAWAQGSGVNGTVRDETAGTLPGVVVELRNDAGSVRTTYTDDQGGYGFEGVAASRYQIAFSLINFASLRREVEVPTSGTVRFDAVLHLSLSADVTVTGKRTFANLADLENPAQDLVGIAQSASQGAITARQLETRPMSRTGEVLETVPGVIISQHSGEGKANQYYLRGFNLDHGTDFAVTVGGVPINMPTHAHGQGYSDLNSLIPELVSGVQFSKGPYFAEQGDFATAGSANINYVNVLDKPIVRATGGTEGFGRALAAGSYSMGSGHLLGALEASHNDGPWVHPDNYRKLNGLLRFSKGDSVNGFSLTAMAYRGTWNSTDQIPQRAVDAGALSRFDAIDPTDGGESYRYSVSGDWQRGGNGSVTRITAYGLGYDLHLFSNFTYFLDDPVRGDQFEQADRRFVSGIKVNHQRLTTWGARPVKSIFGVQLRNDDISNVGLYHTEARVRLDTRSQASVVETGGAAFTQVEVEWTPWLRTLAGLRADAYRFSVTALTEDNSGIRTAGIVSPKGGVAFGPWKGTELYVNAGTGYHSNDARGTVLSHDPGGNPVDRATPLVRAKGAEVGVRTVAIPHLQSTVALWTLQLASELVFTGDAGTTEAGRPSERHGIEWANYYTPRPWLIFDGDFSWSHGRFTESDPVGNFIPGSVQTVASFGVTVESVRNMFGSLRLRYFGPRPLIEDSSVESKATKLVNLQVGYKLRRGVRIAADVFNLLNARDSDIDYFYASRLPGEPAGGVDDIHFHPALPRSARVTLAIDF